MLMLLLMCLMFLLQLLLMVNPESRQWLSPGSSSQSQQGITGTFSELPMVCIIFLLSSTISLRKGHNTYLVTTVVDLFENNLLRYEYYTYMVCILKMYYQRISYLCVHLDVEAYYLFYVYMMCKTIKYIIFLLFFASDKNRDSSLLPV